MTWRYLRKAERPYAWRGHLGNIQGVLDLLSNGFDITAPIRAHLGPADTTATLE
jgi:hypothetical protein